MYTATLQRSNNIFTYQVEHQGSTINDLLECDNNEIWTTIRVKKDNEYPKNIKITNYQLIPHGYIQLDNQPIIPKEPGDDRCLKMYEAPPFFLREKGCKYPPSVSTDGNYHSVTENNPQEEVSFNIVLCKNIIPELQGSLYSSNLLHSTGNLVEENSDYQIGNIHHFEDLPAQLRDRYQWQVSYRQYNGDIQCIITFDLV